LHVFAFFRYLLGENQMNVLKTCINKRIIDMAVMKYFLSVQEGWY